MADSSRHLNLSGASNFRDLGGYIGKDGRRTRWGHLFRSNHLGSLTDDDIAVLRQLGLKSAFDFRGENERTAAACRHDGITVHSLPIEPTTLGLLHERLAAGQKVGTEETIELMCEAYRGFVRRATPVYKTLFTHLLDDTAPLVFHCTAGKDRTGYAAALILSSLGVDEEVIAEDFMLTNRYYRRAETGASSELPQEVRDVMGSVHASFLSAALDTVKSDYGSMDAYFADGLGLSARDRAQLERRYLEP